ncbi:hypothetical protein MKW98_012733 [Papaver atlanticum]|uniref:Uncharacterized protein n=1 Tax=Papaver atlanticum TaxID=357466 RepID=A0AAD4XMA5_9MAGN|nr:hypothetical protein MKW98_012733 [Papaver atlanticum]
MSSLTLSIAANFLLLLFVIPSSFSLTDDDEQPRTYIVHAFKSDKPLHFASHTDWYHSTLQSLPPSPHPKSIIYTYSRVINGFAARLTPSQANHLRSVSGILSVIPEKIRQLHTTRTPEFLGMSANSFGLWSSSNYGDDVIIGVLDSGIWPERRSFSDAGLGPVPARWKGICETGPDFPKKSCNRKIIGARAFYKGAEAGIGHMINETGKDSRSPRDMNGHGTHTASTAAGSAVQNAKMFKLAGGEAKGMAPRARIAVYKVCWSLGCTESDILSGFEKALEDGVDVISFSVGPSEGNVPYDLDTTVVGAFAAMQEGVLVSASGGNSGPRPSTVSNVAPWLLTVAASTLDREFPADVILNDGTLIKGVSLYSGKPLPKQGVELAYAGDVGNEYCLQGKFNSTAKVTGKIVVCEAGNTKATAQGYAVKIAGGVGMISVNVYDWGKGLILEQFLTPAIQVSYDDGVMILKYIRLQKKPTATMKFRGTVTGGSTSAPKVAAFSGRGPNSLTAQILKPDITAPGVSILAAWTGAASPTNLDLDPRRVEFNIISGTSMSCPHISGLATLLRSAYPKWTPAAIKSALMTTSYNLDNSGKNITDLVDGLDAKPFDVGSGHVDPNRALHPGLIYDIAPNDYVAFLCSIGYNSTQLSVFVEDPKKVDCKSIGLSSPGDLNYPSFSVVFGSGSSNKVKYTRTVKNVEKLGSAIYKPTITAPSSVKIKVSPKKLVFSDENRTLSYKITFTSLIKGKKGAVMKEPEFGSIEWRDGVHVVRSPIAFTWITTTKP